MRIRTEAEWREIVAAWESSGVTITEYCKSKQLAHSGFYKWLNRIRRERAQLKPIREKGKFLAPVQEFIAIDVPQVSKPQNHEVQAKIFITTSYGARLEIPL